MEIGRGTGETVHGDYAVAEGRAPPFADPYRLVTNIRARIYVRVLVCPVMLATLPPPPLPKERELSSPGVLSKTPPRVTVLKSKNS